MADDHRPDPVPQQDYNKGSRETFAAMVERMDAGVGAILKALQEARVARNTLVIFMSDNGANRTGRNASFSGYKGNLFEGGIRVPWAQKKAPVRQGERILCVSLPVRYSPATTQGHN